MIYDAPLKAQGGRLGAAGGLGVGPPFVRWLRVFFVLEGFEGTVSWPWEGHYIIEEIGGISTCCAGRGLPLTGWRKQPCEGPAISVINLHW